MTDATREAVLRGLAALRAQGCPIAADPQCHERLADVGLRRWRSVARRHRGRRLGPDDRLRDLVRELVATFEPDRALVGPLVRDYESVAQVIVDAVTSTGPAGGCRDTH